MGFVSRALTSTREIVFGLEDGLVSTLGVITGVAEGTNNKAFVLLTGMVVIFVESLSMAAGTYLSNKSEQEVAIGRLKTKRIHNIRQFLGSKTQKRPIQDSLFMLVSYIVGGMIPILPYIVVAPRTGIPISVLITLGVLFLVGVGKGKVAGISGLRSGIEMLIVSSIAALVGYVVGRVAGRLLPIKQ